MPTSQEQQATADTTKALVKITGETQSDTWSRAKLASQVKRFSGNAESFEDDIRQMAHNLGGGYLFSLPASGLVDDCQRIAALHLPEKSGMGTVFISLDKAGEVLRICDEAEQLKDLEKFAGAFVDVLGRIGPLPELATGESQAAN